MIRLRLLPTACLSLCLSLQSIQAQFPGSTNQGLVGVGRLPAGLFDARGPGLDVLGGFGSAAYFDTNTWSRSGSAGTGYTYSGTFYGTPDRGFGDGTQNYLPRMLTFDFAIVPYYGAGPVPQDQIVMSNTVATFFTYEGTNFTGYDADDLTVTTHPQSSPGSLGGGRRSLDAEGLTPAPGGGWFVSDEYGPWIYKFSSSGALEYTLQPPASVMPKRGNYPGVTAFTATNAPSSGRRNNRGLEGVSVTPDGQRLFAVLQSPAIQDGGASNFSQNTRVLVFDIDPLSPTFKQPIGDYAYQLTLRGTALTNRHTPISEIYALNREEFLVLERDGQGLGTGNPASPTYKRIVMASIAGATNLINSGYELERGAPGQLSFNTNSFPTTVAPVKRMDLVDLIDTNQLVKFGLNIRTNQDANTISEKWESIMLVPLQEASAPHDFLLITINDNDFKAPVVYHNGVAIGTNSEAVDNMALAFRVTLPTFNAPVPANVPPGVALIGPTNATLAGPADFNLTASVHDPDGLVTRVEFFEGANKLGEATSFPFKVSLTGVAAGSHDYQAVATDHSGAVSSSAIKTVVVTADNLAPTVVLAGLPKSSYSQPATFTLSATASDADSDGPVAKVEFFEGDLKLGEDATTPYSLTLSNVMASLHTYHAVAIDRLAARATSAPVAVMVTVTNILPSIAIMSPANGAAFFAPAGITINASADDADGLVMKVEFFQNGTKLGEDPTSPYSLRFTNSTAGIYELAAVATDNQGATRRTTVMVVVNPAIYNGFANKGLVGVGRIPAESFDLLGAGIDTLGGVFSAMHFDTNTWTRTGDAGSGYTYSGTLYAMPDRGFGDGAQDYHPRRQTFNISITPYYGSAPVPQTQIQLSNTATLVLTYNGGTNFTGYDGSNILQQAFPESIPGSRGQGRRSMDPEGLVMMPDGTFFVSDEYGPFIYHFNASGELIGTIKPPEGVISKLGNYPGTNYYTGTTSGASGRRGNRGFEGLSLSPDGTRLVTTLQSPVVQDGGAGNGARNSRVFEFDINPLSPTYGRPVAEYVHHLTLNGNTTTNRNTPLSEVLAVNHNNFLLIERDGNGLGSGSTTPPLYKRIVLTSSAGATNIANTGYDLEKGAPDSASLPTATLPSSVSAMPRMDLIDLLDTNQIGKFGFVVTTNIEPNAVPEKFEGLTLVPLKDPAFPNDYLLLVGSDNDFFAPVVYHNGQPLATNSVVADTLILAYRVTLPGVGRMAPANLPPAIAFVGPTNLTLSAPANFTLAASAYDQDGIVTRVEFYEGGSKLGEDTTFPFTLPLSGVAATNHDYLAVATDHLGLMSTSAVKTVTVTVENILPHVALTGPTNATLSAPARVVLTATAGDIDGSLTRLQIYEGTTLLGETTGTSLNLAVSNVTAGVHTYLAYAIDNQNATNLSAEVSVTVTLDNLAPTVALVLPTNGTTLVAPANFTLTTAGVGDPDGSVTNVTFYRNGARLGAVTAPPWNLAVSNQPLGAINFIAVALDNQGAGTTSAPVAVVVVKNLNTPPLTVQILHASDLEAGVNAVFDAPAFSSVLGALKAQMPANTVILSSGDNYIPGPFYNAAGDPAAGFNGVAGRADIAMINAMGFQAAAFGNHEFDSGTPQVRSLILRDTAVGYAGTLFPYLSANLNFSTDSSMAGLVTTDGKPATAATNQIAKSCVISVAGQQIGIVGATTKDLRSISSPGTVGVNTNIAAAVQAAVDGLMAQGINKIIVLAHLQQYANEIELAQQLRDVDVVIAGGSHAIFAKPTDYLRVGDVASTNYPVWLNTLQGEPVAVVNAGANYEYVGRLIVSFGTNGLISALDSLSGVYATDEQGVANTGNYPTNATVLNIATTIGSIINAKDGNLFGSTTVYLNGLRQFGRTEEVNLGNLTADANLWRGRQADATVSVSLKNGGGIRDSIGAVLGFGGGSAYVPPLPNPSVGKRFGDISQLDIENALRFNNGLALITLTAQQLRDTMEWSVAAVAPGATPGQFPQVGGMWFSYNPTNPPMTYTRLNNLPIGIATPGSRLRSFVALRGDGSIDLVVENGVLVGDPNRTFRMVTLGFLADGGDTYYPLTLGTNRVNLAPTSGNAFTADGSEQWSLATYLTNIQVYTQGDVPMAQDTRIQSLAARTDTVTWPMLTRVEPGVGTRIYFTSLPGKHYHVWASTEVNTGWARVTTTPIAGTGMLLDYLDPIVGSRKFYQIQMID